MLNSLASGRRLALRIILLQLAVALLAGLVFLALGRREAVSAAAGAALVEAIVRDEKKLFTCCVYLDGEFGQEDICLGVPVVIGKSGWEKIVDVELNEEEQAAFNKSADAVRNMNNVLSALNA